MSDKNQLYRLCKKRIINGYERGFCGRLCYGIIPEGYKKEFKTFSEAYLEFSSPYSIFHCNCYKKRKLFSKAQICVIEFRDNYGKVHCATEKSFKSARLEVEYRVSGINYTLETVAKELTASEFFEYCKDNLNIKGD